MSHYINVNCYFGTKYLFILYNTCRVLDDSCLQYIHSHIKQFKIKKMFVKAGPLPLCSLTNSIM